MSDNPPQPEATMPGRAASPVLPFSGSEPSTGMAHNRATLAGDAFGGSETSIAPQGGSKNVSEPGIRVGSLVRTFENGLTGVVIKLGSTGFSSFVTVCYPDGRHSVVFVEYVGLIGSAFDAVVRSLEEDPPVPGEDFIGLHADVNAGYSISATYQWKHFPNAVSVAKKGGAKWWIPLPQIPEPPRIDPDELAFRKWWETNDAQLINLAEDKARKVWMASAKRDPKP